LTDTTQVAMEALVGYQQAAADIADGFEQARRGLVEADVTSDSFGLLQESQGIHTMYAERCVDGLDVLRDGRDVFDALADVMDTIRLVYQGTDQAMANRVGGN
jgi:hypothetical protein